MVRRTDHAEVTQGQPRLVIRHKPSQAVTARHMWSIITWPKPEHDTWVAPSMSRAKS